jgi:glyoxylase-like metal-dependent hydrolase (beta-lactamase superfamily II)
METVPWNVGKFKISQIVETEAGAIIQEALPDATSEAIKKIDWLAPHYADADGHLKAVVQSFVIQNDTVTMIVDTCVGNDKHRVDLAAWGNLQTNYLDKLLAMGIKPTDVTHVLCTHLHFDHIGWNTQWVGGQWVPTFPNARYLFAKDEWAYWQSSPEKEIADDRQGITDSATPVVEAGLVQLIDVDDTVTPGISVFPTPGHTPHHISVLIQSEGHQAIITGDAIHHPCQIHHVDWCSLADFSKEQAVHSRKALLQRTAGSQTLVMGSHFAAPTGGTIVQEGGLFRFVPKTK